MSEKKVWISSDCVKQLLCYEMSPKRKRPQSLLRLDQLQHQPQHQRHEGSLPVVLEPLRREEDPIGVLPELVELLGLFLAADEGETIEQQLADDHAEGVHVLLAAEMVVADRGFRGSVGEGAARGVLHPSALSAQVLGSCSRMEGLTEVYNLHREVPIDDDVSRREIQVSDPVFFQESDGVGEVRQYLQFREGGKPIRPQLISQGGSRQVIHQEAIFVLIILLGRVEVAREVAAFRSPQIRQYFLLVPNSLHAAPLLCFIRAWLAHLHQEGLVDTRLLSHRFLAVFSLFARALTFALGLEDVDGLSVVKLRRRGDQSPLSALEQATVFFLVVLDYHYAAEEKGEHFCVLGNRKMQLSGLSLEVNLNWRWSQRGSEEGTVLEKRSFQLLVVELDDPAQICAIKLSSSLLCAVHKRKQLIYFSQPLSCCKTGLFESFRQPGWKVGKKKQGGSEFLEAIHCLLGQRDQLSRCEGLGYQLFWRSGRNAPSLRGDKECRVAGTGH